MSTLDRLADALRSELDGEHLLTDAAAAPYAVDGVEPGLPSFPR